MEILFAHGESQEERVAGLAGGRGRHARVVSWFFVGPLWRRDLGKGERQRAYELGKRLARFVTTRNS
jgi:hypothetical protein